MKVVQYIAFCVVVTTGLLQSVQIGAFLGVCVLLYVLLFGSEESAQKREYEREKRDTNQPYNPND